MYVHRLEVINMTNTKMLEGLYEIAKTLDPDSQTMIDKIIKRLFDFLLFLVVVISVE